MISPTREQLAAEVAELKAALAAAVRDNQDLTDALTGCRQSCETEQADHQMTRLLGRDRTQPARRDLSAVVGGASHRHDGRQWRAGGWGVVKRHTQAAAALAAYIATIPAANWLVANVPPQPVGLGYVAPAGVYMVGLALVLRDAVRETAGRAAVAVAIGAGAALSFWLATPELAFASAAAFALSETADSLVYEPLRKRGRLTAVAASNAVGLVADSVLFLWLAFGSFAYLPGQLLGKAWMTLAALAAIAVWRSRRKAVTA